MEGLRSRAVEGLLSGRGRSVGALDAMMVGWGRSVQRQKKALGRLDAITFFDWLEEKGVLWK